MGRNKMVKLKRVFKVIENFINHIHQDHSIKTTFDKHTVWHTHIDLDNDRIIIYIKCPELKEHRNALLSALDSEIPTEKHLF